MRDIGLKSLYICLGGGLTLGMGEKKSDFHMFDMCPDLIELFHITHTGPPRTLSKLHSTKYEIYSGGSPSTYVYCVVCYCVIAATHVRSVSCVFSHLYSLVDNSE